MDDEVEIAQLTGLIETIAKLSGDVGGLRLAVEKEAAIRLAESESIEKQNALRDRRIRWSKWAIVIALVVGLLSPIVGFRAQQTADDIVAARTSSRVITCVEANRVAASQHTLWAGLIDIAAEKPGATPPDPQVIIELNTLLDQTFPARDCSPAAVNAYYNK